MGVYEDMWTSCANLSAASGWAPYALSVASVAGNLS